MEVQGVSPMRSQLPGITGSLQGTEHRHSGYQLYSQTSLDPKHSDSGTATELGWGSNEKPPGRHGVRRNEISFSGLACARARARQAAVGREGRRAQPQDRTGPGLTLGTAEVQPCPLLTT